MKEYGKPQRAQSKFNSLCPPEEFSLKNITGNMIACAIEVHLNLGPGLLESVYEKTLAYEFELRGINFERQKEIMLAYKGRNSKKVERWDKKISFVEVTEGRHRTLLRIFSQ